MAQFFSGCASLNSRKWINGCAFFGQSWASENFIFYNFLINFKLNESQSPMDSLHIMCQWCLAFNGFLKTFQYLVLLSQLAKLLESWLTEIVLFEGICNSSPKINFEMLGCPVGHKSSCLIISNHSNRQRSYKTDGCI